MSVSCQHAEPGPTQPCCAARCSGLSPQHPLFTAPDARLYLAQQQRITASVMAGPSSTWRAQQWQFAALERGRVAYAPASRLVAVPQPILPVTTLLRVGLVGPGRRPSHLFAIGEEQIGRPISRLVRLCT